MLPTVYSSEQHGFCPERNCSTALFSLACHMEYAVGNNVPLYLLKLDVAKAYDSVDRAVLD